MQSSATAERPSSPASTTATTTTDSNPYKGSAWFTRYDFLGLGLALSIVLHWGGGDQQMYSVALYMVPSLALLGLSILKAAPLFRRARWAAIPVAAALFLLVWGVIAAMASGAPQVVTIFGEWGRADGLLNLISVIALMLAVATAPLAAISRMLAWVFVAAGIALTIGYLEYLFNIRLVSTAFANQSFASTFGNINFSAGFFATTGALAVFMAFYTKNWFARIALLLYFAGTAVSMGPNGSLQGPLALVVGIGAGIIALLLMIRGRWRIPALVVSAVSVTAGLVLTVLTLAERGPLGAAFYADYGIVVRRLFWEAAFGIIQDYPIFGVGPDGFSRYVAQYRSDEYVSTLGLLAENAVHSVPLHTMVGYGIPGLVAWLLVMVGSLVGLLLFLAKIPSSAVRSIRWIGAAAAAGIAGYVAQAAVSIDFYSLKATGWFMAGAAIAVVLRSLESQSSNNPSAESGSKKPSTVTNSRLLSAWGLGAMLAIAGVVSVAWWTSAVPKIGAITPDQAKAIITSPWVHCSARVQWLNELQRAQPEAVPSVQELMATDPRCYPFTSNAAGTLVSSTDAESQEIVQFYETVDPKSFVSQAYLAQSRLIAGDLEGAKAAQDEMNRLAAMSKDVDQEFVAKVNTLLEQGYEDAAAAQEVNASQ